MLFKKFDFISPQITLYFKGDEKHSSIFSGIVTIISYTLIFIFMIYDIRDFINPQFIFITGILKTQAFTL